LQQSFDKKWKFGKVSIGLARSCEQIRIKYQLGEVVKRQTLYWTFCSGGSNQTQGICQTNRFVRYCMPLCAAEVKGGQ
jgi:hypothetical protein